MSVAVRSSVPASSPPAPVPELTTPALHATMADLAPVAQLAAAGGLRALPAEPRDGQTGGGDPQAFVDRMHNRGDAARARRAWSRLQGVPPVLQVTLLWLADRGDARPDVGTAALLYARERGPIALRDAADLARARREAADRAHGKALRRSKRLLTAEVAALHDVLTQRTREESGAVERLRAWGRRELSAGVAAWIAAGAEKC